MELGELAPAETASTIPKNRLTIEIKRTTAKPAALELGAPHPGTDAFDDNGAF